PVVFLLGHRQGETPGTAGRRVREFQGRRGAHHAIRYARAFEPRAQCKRGEGFHQLVSLARRPDRSAKIFSQDLRRAGRFTAHRYSEKRRAAGGPPRRGSRLSRHRQSGRMDGDDAGAGNFRRGARECEKTKKVIEPFDKAQDRPMIKSSCASGPWSNICHHEEPSAATPQPNFGLSLAKPCDPAPMIAISYSA